jgi:hypothetical protein
MSMTLIIYLLIIIDYMYTDLITMHQSRNYLYTIMYDTYYTESGFLDFYKS